MKIMLCKSMLAPFPNHGSASAIDGQEGKHSGPMGTKRMIRVAEKV